MKDNSAVDIMLNVEETILGNLMLYPELIPTLTKIISEESFSNKQCRIIYSAISQLVRNQENIDLRTVVNHLKKTQQLEIAGGVDYLLSIIPNDGKKSRQLT